MSWQLLPVERTASTIPRVVKIGLAGRYIGFGTVEPA